MEFLTEFLEWAWARHHNVWSWYIRPLFFLPFCYFSYCRQPLGIFLTLVGLATSMFWFPIPTTPNPAAVAALASERAYLEAPWTAGKVLLALLIPLCFAALGAACWYRSLKLGLLVINAAMLTKILWTTFHFSVPALLAFLAPALFGLLVCNGLFLWSIRYLQRLNPGGDHSSS